MSLSQIVVYKPEDSVMPKQIPSNILRYIFPDYSTQVVKTGLQKYSLIAQF